MLDQQITRELSRPNAWELAHYRGGSKSARAEWSRLFDEAPAFRHDDSVLRVVEREQRCAPAAAHVTAAPRVTVFRAVFRRDGVNLTDTWLDADNWIDDGGSKAYALIDHIDDTHYMSQAVSGNSAVFPATDALFASANTLNFTGSVWYDSSRLAAAWKYLHDGSGCELWVQYALTSASNLSWLLSATIPNGSGSFVGVDYHAYPNVIVAGNGGRQVDAAPGAALALANDPTSLNFSLLGTNWRMAVRAATPLLSGTSGTLPTGNPSAPLRLGGFTGGTPGAGSFKFRSFYLIRRRSNATEGQIVRSWIKKDCGITYAA